MAVLGSKNKELLLKIVALQFQLLRLAIKLSQSGLRAAPAVSCQKCLLQISPLQFLQDADLTSSVSLLPILEIGFFFDGTSNSKSNSRDPTHTSDSGSHRKGEEGYHSKSSYDNAESNVALLSEAYVFGFKSATGGEPAKQFRSAYFEGVGARAGKKDRAVDAGTGRGITGVSTDVSQALKRLKKVVGKADQWQEIRIDVFGFSRGAAAARYFIDCVDKGYFYENLSPTQRIRPVFFIPDCKVRFVGLFDTVVSTTWAGDLLNAADDNDGPINVFLKDGIAKKIVHLTAKHEVRKYFALHSVGHGSDREEIELPGAHADIGGGYKGGGDSVSLEKKFEEECTSFQGVQFARAKLRNKASQQRSSMINIGWITKDDLPPSGVTIGNEDYFKKIDRKSNAISYLMAKFEADDYIYRGQIRLDRPWVQPGLNTIALHIMHKKALEAEVPLKAIPSGNPQWDIPVGLNDASKRLIAGESLSPEMEKAVLRDFGHHSVNFDDPKLDKIRKIYVNEPNPRGRKIWPN